MKAVNIAASGLRSQQTRLDTIGANISNVSTMGYKSTRVDFKDALYATMKTPVGDAGEQNLLSGSGVLVGATYKNFSEGAAQTTEKTLDFAISGDGFFTVEDAESGILYTRNGSFGLSAEEGGNFLVTTGGQYVLDDNGERITVPENASISVLTGGELRANDEVFANLGIVRFPNMSGLSAAGGNCYAETAASGAPQNAADAGIEQGMLEGSNVDLAQELTLMMRTQRAYTLASQALRTADDMEGLANNMR